MTQGLFPPRGPCGSGRRWCRREAKHGSSACHTRAVRWTGTGTHPSVYRGSDNLSSTLEGVEPIWVLTLRCIHTDTRVCHGVQDGILHSADARSTTEIPTPSLLASSVLVRVPFLSFVCPESFPFSFHSSFHWVSSRTDSRVRYRSKADRRRSRPRLGDQDTETSNSTSNSHCGSSTTKIGLLLACLLRGVRRVGSRG